MEKNFQQFYKRAAKHMAISNLREKLFKNFKQSAIFDHLLQSNCATNFRPVWLNGWVFVYELSGCGFESRCNHSNFDGFSFVATDSNKFKLLLREICS